MLDDADESPYQTCSNPSIGATGPCTSCTSTVANIPVSFICTDTTLGYLGIQVAPGTGTTYNITVPTGVVTIDSTRLSNAISAFGNQLPSGSLSGYISDLGSTLGNELSSNARDTFEVLLGVLILYGLLLYSILCITLMASSVIGIAIGITLIFIGLIFAAIIGIILYYDVSNFANNLYNDVSNRLQPVISNLTCALTAGICCYSGGLQIPFHNAVPCCCPNGSQTPVCANKP